MIAGDETEHECSTDWETNPCCTKRAWETFCDFIDSHPATLEFVWGFSDGEGGAVLDKIHSVLPERKVIPSRRKLRKPIDGDTRRRVHEKSGYRCVVCAGYEYLTVDHIVPVSIGGTNDEDNLQTMCRSCNSRKGNRV